MIFEQVATGGCQSYLIGCADTCAGALIDPEVSQVDRYLALAARDGLRIRFVIDTHTHADHFSASRQIADKLGALTVMHRASPAPGVDMRVDDGEIDHRRQAAPAGAAHAGPHRRLDVPRRRRPRLHRRHAADRRHRPHRPAERRPGGALRQPVRQLLKLDPALLVYPAHDYKGRSHSTIGAEIERQSAPAAARPRGLRADDEEPRPVDADPPHRGAAHQHERRQDGRRDARRGGGVRALHEHGRAAHARRVRPQRHHRSRRAREGRLRRRPHPGRAPAAARPARAARRQGVARSDARASSPAASSAASRRSPPRPCGRWASSASSPSTAA